MPAVESDGHTDFGYMRLVARVIEVQLVVRCRAEHVLDEPTLVQTVYIIGMYLFCEEM